MLQEYILLIYMLSTAIFGADVYRYIKTTCQCSGDSTCVKHPFKLIGTARNCRPQQTLSRKKRDGPLCKKGKVRKREKQKRMIGNKWRRLLGWNRKRKREERKNYEKTKCVGRRKLILVTDRPFQENPLRPEMRPEGKRRQMRDDRMGCTADVLWLSASRRLCLWDHTHSCTQTPSFTQFSIPHLTPEGSDTFSMPHHLWGSGVLALLTMESETGAGFIAKANRSCSDSIIMSALCETQSPQCVYVCTCLSLYRSPLQERVWCWISSHTELHTEEWQCLVYDSGKWRGEDEGKGTRRRTAESRGGTVKHKEGEEVFLTSERKWESWMKRNQARKREIWKEHKKKRWEMSLVWGGKCLTTKTK